MGGAKTLSCRAVGPGRSDKKGDSKGEKKERFREGSVRKDGANGGQDNGA